MTRTANQYIYAAIWKQQSNSSYIYYPAALAHSSYTVINIRLVSPKFLERAEIGPEGWEEYSQRCDRILSFGKGIRQLRYGRSELKFSDHRPVSATYMVEVEVFSPRKLQRALTFTDAEIAKEEIVTNMGLENGMNRFISDQGESYWMR
ncbi:hypothetical protein H5410_023716 [Solanum commersonii]|uniref:Uncharacterized protein n=1 Tax=Solanum commersonii TaxID=4109 RepID=A0A9J5ZHN1_SOLCO|nr:hypothetical protein H5410_023716 [Solanum commersonii]